MKFQPLVSAPAFTGFGVLANADANGGQPALGIEYQSNTHVRRMDRYGILGLAAARAAIESAGVAPPSDSDAQWGVNVGSSLGCWSSNTRFYVDLLKNHVAAVSPALFVRTVSNAVTGDLSITLHLGGASETFVSGWTAGADAVASAAAALDENKARRMLAGAVEVPGEIPPAALSATDSDWSPPALREAAAFALLEREASGDPLRLRAWWRGHDPSRRWSLLSALDATAHLGIQAIVVANSIPDEMRTRWQKEAGSLPFVYLAEESAELGAVGAVVALSTAAARGLASVLVVCRGVEGNVVALAASR